MQTNSEQAAIRTVQLKMSPPVIIMQWNQPHASH